MGRSVLERLAEVELPPVPTAFESGVHQRLNDRLLHGHLVDFVVRAMPYAALHLAQSLGALLWYSLTGTFPREKEK